MKKMGIKYAMLCSITITFLLSLLLIPSLLTSSKSHPINHSNHNLIQQKNPYPVSFAYLISASKGDVNRLIRLLTALYHPANYYLLHLDLEAEPEEHHHLYRAISSHPTFTRIGNVWIVEKSNLVTYRGPTMLTTTLHAMAILLRTCQWDWFINLSASDYPLITQDDLITAFSNLPRDLNFVQHTSHLGWKIKKRAKPVMIDPALYDTSNKTEITWLPFNRTVPTAFKLYTGSAWTMLSRSFAEYSIIGWDNFPRTLLLYYANFVSSPEGYFQTLICNSDMYRNTTVNHDMHYITWDNPPKQHPLNLGIKDYRRMVLSSRIFARKFKKDDPVLYKIDRELLRRKGLQFTYGGWCYDDGKGMCTNSSYGASGVLKPGAGARRLKSLLTKLLSAKNFNKRQCK